MHSRIGSFVALLRDDQPVRLIAKAIAQADDVIPAKIVVLIEDRDLGIGDVFLFLPPPMRTWILDGRLSASHSGKTSPGPDGSRGFFHAVLF
jgi:hypothetical protein